MAGYVLLAFLAALGLLSAMWALAGWLLPSGQGAVLVCLELPDPGVLSRYRWLRGMGLISCPLVAVTETGRGQALRDTEICSREELLPRLEQEKMGSHGTGTGNPSGRGQRCDLSEL